MKAKGARPRTRRRGAACEDFVLEAVYWDAGTARLLPRLLKGRTRGPVFVTHRKPGPGKVVSPRDICPDTGLARLSYGQARMLLDEHTTLGCEPGAGWDLYELLAALRPDPPRRGRASLLILMAKSGTRKRRTYGSISTPPWRRSPKSPACSLRATAAADPRAGCLPGTGDQRYSPRRETLDHDPCYRSTVILAL